MGLTVSTQNLINKMRQVNILKHVNTVSSVSRFAVFAPR